MLTPATVRKLAHGLASLREDQLAGLAPAPGDVTRAELARRAGVSEGTIANIERMFTARLAAEILRDPAAPHHLAKIAKAAIHKI